jgi:hypothetical protein
LEPLHKLIASLAFAPLSLRDEPTFGAGRQGRGATLCLAFASRAAAESAYAPGSGEVGGHGYLRTGVFT